MQFCFICSEVLKKAIAQNIVRKTYAIRHKSALKEQQMLLVCSLNFCCLQYRKGVKLI